MTDTLTFEAVRKARTIQDLLILGEYAVSDNVKVRAAAATNKFCPPEYLAYLSGDKEELVLSEVARNKNTPTEILSVLARKRSLIQHVSYNDNLRGDLLVRLVDSAMNAYRQDKDLTVVVPVLSNALKNPNITYNTARKIVKSGITAIFEAAFTCPVLDAALISHMIENVNEKNAPQVYEKASSHTATDVASLEIIASSNTAIFTRKNAVRSLLKRPDYADWPVEWLYSQFGIE